MQLINTAASGLQSQTARLDAISNNIANLDTTGYQSVDVSFADTLTQVYAQPDATSAASGLPDRLTPTGNILGTGVYALPGQRYFAQGSLTSTGNPLDMAVQGDGFFEVQLANGQTGYTRAGDFQAVQDPETGGFVLATKTGQRVLGTDGQPIRLDNISVNTVSVSPDGTLTGDTKNGQPVKIGQLGLAYVGNPASALYSAGNDNYGLNPGYTAVTNTKAGAQSGQLIGTVKGGALETSNVNLTDQMSEMIETQHDFQMAAQAVNIADKMMGLADTIK